jgi:DNA transformation protein
MAKDATYLALVMESLKGLGSVEARRMFGAHGLYADGVFFAIVHRGRLWLRADDAMRGELAARGSGPFRPNARQTIASYWEAPAEVVEDPRALTAWARRAVAAQRAAKPPGARAARRRAGAGATPRVGGTSADGGARRARSAARAGRPARSAPRAGRTRRGRG